MGAKEVLLSIYTNGVPATIKTIVGGTQCPCMTSRGSTAPAYSAQWHRQNPTADDCGGTGLLGGEVVLVSIRTIAIDASAIGNSVRAGFSQTDIGKIGVGDMAFYGAVLESSGENYSLEGLKDWNEVTVHGMKYAIKSTVIVPVETTLLSAALGRRLS